MYKEAIIMANSNKKTWSSFGECFKELRTDANMSLEELSEISKIQIIHLQNLEQENFDSLPPYVYVRGFIQRLSAILSEKIAFENSNNASIKSAQSSSGGKGKKDASKRYPDKLISAEDYSWQECSDTLLRLYINKQGIYNISHQRVGEPYRRESMAEPGRRRSNGYNYEKKDFFWPKALLTPRAIVYFGTILFLGVVSTYLAGRFVPFFFAPEIELGSPASENTVVNFQELNVKGKIEWVSALTLQDKEVYIDENGEFQEKIKLSEGINMLVLEGKNIFGRKVEIVRRVVYIKN